MKRFDEIWILHLPVLVLLFFGVPFLFVLPWLHKCLYWQLSWLTLAVLNPLKSRPNLRIPTHHHLAPPPHSLPVWYPQHLRSDGSCPMNWPKGALVWGIILTYSITLTHREGLFYFFIFFDTERPLLCTSQTTSYRRWFTWSSWKNSCQTVQLLACCFFSSKQCLKGSKISVIYLP